MSDLGDIMARNGEMGEVKPEGDTTPVSFDSMRNNYTEIFEGIESEEDFKSVVERGKKYGDLKKSHEELSATWAKGHNVRDQFANDDLFYQNEALKKGGDSMDRSVLSSLTPSKIKDMTPWDAMVTNLMLQNPDLEGGKSGAEEYLKSKLGIDYIDELEGADKTKVQIEGKQAKKDLSTIFEGIEIPESTDWETYSKTKKEALQPKLEGLLGEMQTIKITDALEFEVDESMKTAIKNDLISALAVNNIDVNDETKSIIEADIRKELIFRNIDKIIEIQEADLRAKWDKETSDKLHGNDFKEEIKSTGGQLTDDEKDEELIRSKLLRR